MDDVKDQFASLFAQTKGEDFATLPEIKQSKYRRLAEKALKIVDDNKEILYYLYGAATSDEVAERISRHHMGIAKALKIVQDDGRTVTFPCPACGDTVTVKRKTNEFGTIYATCKCGNIIKLT